MAFYFSLKVWNVYCSLAHFTDPVYTFSYIWKMTADFFTTSLQHVDRHRIHTSFFTHCNPNVYHGVNENKSALLKIRGRESGTAK